MHDHPRTLALIGDETGPSLWRVWMPMTALSALGRVADWDYKDNADRILPIIATGRYDAIILPRLAWREHEAGRQWIASLHRAGLAVIAEYDDDVFSEDIIERQYRVHDRERAKGKEQLAQDRLDRIAVLQQADGVTVSTRRLATVVREHTDKPVCVVPNAIDTRWWRRTLRGVSRVVPPLTIGWCGGARYPEDLAAMAEGWRRIASRYPDVTFVVQGHMAEVLINAVPPERVRRLPWLPLQDYPRAMLNVDIGCAAVTDKHFNRCKTPIKVWEYTLSGAVVVASRALYGAVVTDGEDGLLADTPDEWEAALARLVEDASLRRTLWKEQRRRVAREHSLERNLWRWEAAWTAIISDFRARQTRAMLTGRAA